MLIAAVPCTVLLEASCTSLVELVELKDRFIRKFKCLAQVQTQVGTNLKGM